MTAADIFGAAAAGATIAVTVDGERHALPASATLDELIERLGCDPASVATAVNGAFVARECRGAQPLRDGDSVACFRAIVGG